MDGFTTSKMQKTFFARSLCDAMAICFRVTEVAFHRRSLFIGRIRSKQIGFESDFDVEYGNFVMNLQPASMSSSSRLSQT